MKTKKRGKRVMRIFAIIIGAIVVLNLVGLIVNSVFFKNELKAFKPYGQMVDVQGRQMHVHSMGSGEETIVLLPGWGVALPSADFGPLMRKLSEKYTVVTVEYFGTGFSDQTDTARTNDNYTQEIRTALEKAGFHPPYILMPHSASGIYSEYYAAKYPQEVSSIIMLDTTSTVKIEKVPGFVRGIYSFAKFQQATGFTRITFALAPDTKRVENGYMEQELADHKRFNYHVLNDTMIEQSLMFMDNIQEVKEIPFPSDIPVLKIIAKDTEKRMGMEYHTDHLNRLGTNVSYKVVEGTHLLYQTAANVIAELTVEFLSQ